MSVALHHSSHMFQYIVCCRNTGKHCDLLMPLVDELVAANNNIVSRDRVQRATSLLVCNRVAPAFDTFKTIVRLFAYAINDFITEIFSPATFSVDWSHTSRSNITGFFCCVAAYFLGWPSCNICSIFIT